MKSMLYSLVSNSKFYFYNYQYKTNQNKARTYSIICLSWRNYCLEFIVLILYIILFNYLKILNFEMFFYDNFF